MDYIPHPNRSFLPQFERYEPVVQDSTAMKLLKRCDRKYFYRIVLGKTVKNNYNQIILDAGSIYHKYREFLEIFYKEGKDFETCLAEATKIALQYKELKPQSTGKWQYVDQVLMLKSFAYAFKHWVKQKESGTTKVIGNEQFWNCQLPDGTLIGGRNDQLWKQNGLLWIPDFKFTSQDKTQFDKSVEPNDQATRYLYGAQKLHGPDVQGVIFECLSHQKAKDPTIFVSPTQRTKSQLLLWEKEQIQLNEQLALNRKNDIWPMRELNGSYDNKGCSWCEYVTICRRPSETSMAAVLRSDYKTSPWNCMTTEQMDID